MVKFSGPNMTFQTIDFDPMCDKDHPQRISFEDVSAAAFRIKSGIIKTPCVVSIFFYKFNVYFKYIFFVCAETW